MAKTTKKKKWSKRADTFQNTSMTGWKKSSLIGDTSSNGCFLVVMLVFGGISTWRWMSVRIGCLSELVFLGRFWCEKCQFLFGVRKKNLRCGRKQTASPVDCGRCSRSLTLTISCGETCSGWFLGHHAKEIDAIVANFCELNETSMNIDEAFYDVFVWIMGKELIGQSYATGRQALPACSPLPTKALHTIWCLWRSSNRRPRRCPHWPFSAGEGNLYNLS